MAGIFLSFLIEYLGHRFVSSRAKKTLNPAGDGLVTERTAPKASSHDSIAAADSDAESKTRGLAAFGHHHSDGAGTLSQPADRLSVLVMEAGIIFHSIRKSPPVPALPTTL
jgi:zinc transporter 1/2/3